MSTLLLADPVFSENAQHVQSKYLVVFMQGALMSHGSMLPFWSNIFSWYAESTALKCANSNSLR
eukprot:IDg18577t1